MTLKKYDAGPRPSRKNTTGVSGGVAHPVGLDFGIPPAARVRVRPHYPELPGPCPRRDIGWVKYSKLKAKKDLSIPTRPP